MEYLSLFLPVALGCLVTGALAGLVMARRTRPAAVSIRPWANAAR
jgi:hypothetical protein